MAQNAYDNAEFFDRYIQLPRQVHGLDGAPEWPTMRAMIPPLVDLGCGFGWISRWVVAAGAASVVEIDLSDRMLDRARSAADNDAVSYQQCDLDELNLDPQAFDIALSSLALHYVHDLPRLLRTIEAALVPGGALVFSVEHPIYSAASKQDFEAMSDGRLVWPLEQYLVEGPRQNDWFIDGVIKQHRTVATYVNQVVDAGFRIDHIVEWGPSPEQITERPELAVDLHRPWFLLVAASKSD